MTKKQKYIVAVTVLYIVVSVSAPWIFREAQPRDPSQRTFYAYFDAAWLALLALGIWLFFRRRERWHSRYELTVQQLRELEWLEVIVSVLLLSIKAARLLTGDQHPLPHLGLPRLLAMAPTLGFLRIMYIIGGAKKKPREKLEAQWTNCPNCHRPRKYCRCSSEALPIP